MDELDCVRESGRLCSELAGRLPALHSPAPTQTFATPPGVQVTSKVPSKLVAVVGSFAWRASDLGELSHELFERQRTVPAIVLTRSAMECAALIYLTYKKSTQALDARSLKDLDAFLVACMSGSRTNPETEPRAPNVLTAIGHLDKESGAEGFAAFYDALCEFAHPNALGGFYAYANYRPADRAVQFGHNQGMTKAGDAAFALVFALEIVIEFYDRVIELLPRVGKLSEQLYPDA